MSFESKNFSIMAYTNGFTFWNYVTTDTLTNVKKSGYFNSIAPFARVGDMVCITANMKGEPISTILAVTKINDGKVSLNGLAV